jgi:hypothetical protein
MRKAALCAILMACGGSALAAEWVHVATNTTGAKVSVDTETIQFSRTPRVWVEFDYSNDATVSERSARELWKFDCAQQTSITLSSVTYNAQGKVTRSRANHDYSYGYEPIVPGTIGASIMKIVCDSVQKE